VILVKGASENVISAVQKYLLQENYQENFYIKFFKGNNCCDFSTLVLIFGHMCLVYVADA